MSKKMPGQRPGEFGGNRQEQVSELADKYPRAAGRGL